MAYALIWNAGHGDVDGDGTGSFPQWVHHIRNDNWAFSADCEDIDPLLDLVEYLFSDDAYLLTNYGVEDVTYTLDEDGKPHYTDLIINNPDGLSYFFASYVYATNAASGFFPFLNDMSRTFFDFTENQWQVNEDLRTLSDCAWNYPRLCGHDYR